MMILKVMVDNNNILNTFNSFFKGKINNKNETSKSLTINSLIQRDGKSYPIIIKDIENLISYSYDEGMDECIYQLPKSMPGDPAYRVESYCDTLVEIFISRGFDTKKNKSKTKILINWRNPLDLYRSGIRIINQK